jgi:hypothetical protein
VDPDEKRQFEVSETYLGDPVEIPVTVIDGEADGLRICLATTNSAASSKRPSPCPDIRSVTASTSAAGRTRQSSAKSVKYERLFNTGFSPPDEFEN